MNIKILNITHGNNSYYSNGCFFPIKAGSSSLDIASDDSGDNISTRNPYYCEMTAIYWAWKNLKDTDIIGISHYRRYILDRLYLTKIWYGIDIARLEKYNFCTTRWELSLQEYDIICPKKHPFGPLTCKEQYELYHDKHDLEILKEVIADLSSDALPALEKYYQDHDSFICNIFITKWEEFDNYCKWIFPILFETERRLSCEGLLEKRVIGYLSERLLNVYIEYKKLRVCEYPMLLILDEPCKSLIRQELGAIIWKYWLTFRVFLSHFINLDIKN